MSIFNVYRKLLLAVAICFSMTAAAASNVKSNCRASGKLLITEYPELNNTLESAITDIRSPEIIDSVIKDLTLDNSSSHFISKEELLKGITIKSLLNQGIFYIYYQHSDSQFATKVVNSLIKNYIQTSQLKNKNQAIVLKKLIVQQIERKQQELKIAGEELLALHNKKDKNTTIEEQQKMAEAQSEFGLIQREYADLMVRLQEVSVAKNRGTGNIRTLDHVVWSCYDEDI